LRFECLGLGVYIISHKNDLLIQPFHPCQCHVTISDDKIHPAAQKCSAIVHYKLGVSTQSTLREVKHFNSAPITMLATNHHIGVRQSKRNMDVLTVTD